MGLTNHPTYMLYMIVDATGYRYRYRKDTVMYKLEMVSLIKAKRDLKGAKVV
jgi:hypothetical protein